VGVALEVMTKMRTRIRVLALVSVLIAVTMVAVVPPMPPAHAQFFSLSEEEEIKLGRQVEAEVQQKYGFVNDPGLTQYVANIGLRLAKVSERPNLPWTYHIVRDPSVNAFAVLGGFVFVTRGLLRFVQSENELGFVLGHETTHIAHRHAVDLAQRDMEVQFGAILLTRLLFGGSLTAYQLSQVARGLIDAKYSREKEFEADHYGVIFARQAGFDPTASVTFFERLQQLEQRRQNAVGGAFASHPPTPDRIKAVKSELRQMGYRVPGGEDSAPEASPAPPAPAPQPTPAATTSTRRTAPVRSPYTDDNK
jgi:beta-barrel assembly-enhancing protease